MRSLGENLACSKFCENIGFHWKNVFKKKSFGNKINKSEMGVFGDSAKLDKNKNKWGLWVTALLNMGVLTAQGQQQGVAKGAAALPIIFKKEEKEGKKGQKWRQKKEKYKKIKNQKNYNN